MRLILALLGIISATAFAHDLWVEKEGIVTSSSRGIATPPMKAPRWFPTNLQR